MVPTALFTYIYRGRILLDKSKNSLDEHVNYIDFKGKDRSSLQLTSTKLISINSLKKSKKYALALEGKGNNFEEDQENERIRD